MSAGDLLTLFGGAGGGTAFVWCVLLITRVVVPKGTYDEMVEQRDEWKRTAELNAARAEAGVIAGQVVKDAMQGIRKELT